MRSTVSNYERLRQRLFTRSTGWTGIEIGCHAISMAQVCKVKERWQLSAVWSLEHPRAERNEQEPSTSKSDQHFGWFARDEMFEYGLSLTLKNAEKLSSLFQGNRCAATLTDGIIAYRELDLPSNDLSEARAMIRSEVALETESEEEDLLTDCWEMPQSNLRASTHCFGAVSIKRSEASQVASDLLLAGFECQTLDAIPCAMARSTAMMIKESETSTIAIDLGYQHTTLTLVKAGRPILARELRGLGLIALLDQIAIAFEINQSDAQTLLFQTAGDLAYNETSALTFSNPIHQQLSTFFQLLTLEIDKTLHYANRACRFAIPSQILLMGAGSRIANVAQSVAERTGLPSQNWQIDLSENLFGDQFSSVFAIAAGLSALAWEPI